MNTERELLHDLYKWFLSECGDTPESGESVTSDVRPLFQRICAALAEYETIRPMMEEGGNCLSPPATADAPAKVVSMEQIVAIVREIESITEIDLGLANDEYCTIHEAALTTPEPQTPPSAATAVNTVEGADEYGFDQWYAEEGEGETVEHVARKAWNAAALVMAGKLRPSPPASASMSAEVTDEQLGDVIEFALKSYRAQHTVRDDEECSDEHMPLVDLLSPPGSDVGVGYEEITLLADHIFCAVRDLLAERARANTRAGVIASATHYPSCGKCECGGMQRALSASARTAGDAKGAGL